MTSKAGLRWKWKVNDNCGDIHLPGVDSFGILEGCGSDNNSPGHGQPTFHVTSPHWNLTPDGLFSHIPKPEVVQHGQQGWVEVEDLGQLLQPM